MNNVRDKASDWAQAVGQWVGDSPKKAATFGVVVFLLGSAWGGWLEFWPF